MAVLQKSGELDFSFANGTTFSATFSLRAFRGVRRISATLGVCSLLEKLAHMIAAGCVNVCPHRIHPARRHSAKCRISKTSARTGFAATTKSSRTVFTFSSRRVPVPEVSDV